MNVCLYRQSCVCVRPYHIVTEEHLPRYAGQVYSGNVIIGLASVRPSVRPVVAYSSRLTRGQHAMRPAYISVRVLRGRTYLLLRHSGAATRAQLFSQERSNKFPSWNRVASSGWQRGAKKTILAYPRYWKRWDGLYGLVLWSMAEPSVGDKGQIPPRKR